MNIANINIIIYERWDKTEESLTNIYNIIQITEISWKH